ncbi:hypothetical protein [Comamonas testosteroni]|uniref:hypothetical protein n=1 Tax=Comamonas testosteroni TaxID=285 RepID=UPI0005B4F410|nr:hypothetical protein [Comamonas testosteroni]
MHAKFSLGHTEATRAALSILEQVAVSHNEILDAHASQNPAMISELQLVLNKEAIENGDRVISDFTLAGNKVVRVSTVHNRSYTTIMLPNEM